MKCWYLAFNAQGSRIIIVVVQLGPVKIYVAAVEALMKKERQDETQFTTKMDGFLSFIRPLNAYVLFCRFFLISPCVWPNSGFWCCVFLTLHITLMRETFFNSSSANHYGWPITSSQFHLFLSSWRALYQCWTCSRAQTEFQSTNITFAIVVNAVRTRVLLQSFPLSQAFALFFFTLSCCVHP